MTDHLDRLIRATEGQPPSADFVARLRAQIVAETEGADGDAVAVAVSSDPTLDDATAHDDALPVVFDIEPAADNELDVPIRRAQRRDRRQRLAAVAAVAAALVGAWGLLSTFGEGDPARDDTVTATSAPPGPDNGDAGALLTAGNTFFDAGTHRIDTLGTAFTFSVDETTRLYLNANGMVSITDLTSAGAADRTMTLRRTTLLPDPSDPTARLDPSGEWTVDDIPGWVAALGSEVTASESIDTTLGGLDATLVVLEVGSLACDVGDCSSETAVAQPDSPMFTHGSAYRMWVVDQGDEDPVVITVAVDDPDETAWFDEADAILATLEFGSVQPSPARRVAAGPAQLDVFGGISVQAPDGVVIVEPFDRFVRLLPGRVGGDVEFLTRPLDSDGVELTSTDQLLRLLADEAVDVAELGSQTIGGLEARAFAVSSGPFPNVVLKIRFADLVRPEFGWESPQQGHLWIIEHPDRGLLLVSAESLTGPDAIEPLRSWTADLLQSLEFREP